MKFVCIGRNYLSHILEMKNEIPTEPQIFLKPSTAYLANNGTFLIPSFSNNLHYEAEIVVKMNDNYKHVKVADAHKCYDEVSLGIDFTARDLQSKFVKIGMSWELAKAFDNSAAIGDFISKSQLADLYDFNFQLNINNHTVQKGNVKDMVFNIDQIISFVSDYFTLEKGDIIFTGTPSGVGKVQPGDVLKGAIEDQHLLQIYIQ